jgi:hypothetical protein
VVLDKKEEETKTKPKKVSNHDGELKPSENVGLDLTTSLPPPLTVSPLISEDKDTKKKFLVDNDEDRLMIRKVLFFEFV